MNRERGPIHNMQQEAEPAEHDLFVPVSTGLVRADATALADLDNEAKKHGQTTVMYVIPYVLRPDAASGVWQSLLSMMDELKSIGVNPVILTGKSDGNENANYMMGRPVRIKRNSTTYEGTFLARKRSAKKALRESQPDVVVSEESLASTLNWTVIRAMPRDRSGNRPAPVVGHHHGRIESLDKTTKIFEQIVRRVGMMKTIARSYASLTSPSYATKDFWVDIFDGLIDGKEYLVIPNAIDLEELAPKGREKLWDDGRKTVVFTGRLEDRKGVLTLMEAICKYTPRDAFKHIKFKIGGEGPLKEQLLQMRADAGLSDNEVEFIGFLNRDNSKVDLLDPQKAGKPDLLQVIESMDIGVASSNEGEGEGIWAKEICAAGKLAIITRIDGHNEVIKGAKESFFRGIPPNNPQAMAAGILELAGISSSWAGDLGKEGVLHMQKYSAKVIAPQHFEIYTKTKEENDLKRKVQWDKRRTPKRIYRGAKVAMKRPRTVFRKYR